MRDVRGLVEEHAQASSLSAAAVWRAGLLAPGEVAVAGGGSGGGSFSWSGWRPPVSQRPGPWRPRTGASSKRAAGRCSRSLAQRPPLPSWKSWWPTLIWPGGTPSRGRGCHSTLLTRRKRRWGDGWSPYTRRPTATPGRLQGRVSPRPRTSRPWPWSWWSTVGAGPAGERVKKAVVVSFTAPSHFPAWWPRCPWPGGGR